MRAGDFVLDWLWYRIFRLMNLQTWTLSHSAHDGRTPISHTSLRAGDTAITITTTTTTATI
jgi:hypothetical protein